MTAYSFDNAPAGSKCPGGRFRSARDSFNSPRSSTKHAAGEGIHRAAGQVALPEDVSAMRRLLLPCAVVLSTVAIAGPVLAEEAPPTPMSTVAADRAGDRAAVEWTAQRMERAAPAPRIRHAARHD